MKLTLTLAILLSSCCPAKQPQIQREIVLQTKHPHSIEIGCGAECPDGFDCSSKCAFDELQKQIVDKIERLETEVMKLKGKL